MKKILKGICVLSLLVSFTATANVAGMIKDYHTVYYGEIVQAYIL